MTFRPAYAVVKLKHLWGSVYMLVIIITILFKLLNESDRYRKCSLFCQMSTTGESVINIRREGDVSSFSKIFMSVTSLHFIWFLGEMLKLSHAELYRDRENNIP